MRISIRVSILLTLLLLIFISSGMLIAIFYVNSKLSVRFLMHNIMRTMSVHVTDKCINYLDTAAAGSRLSERLAFSEVLKTKNVKELIEYSKGLLKVNRHFNMVNYGDANGNFLMTKRMSDNSFSIKKVMREGKIAKTIWEHENVRWSKKYSNKQEPSNKAYDPRTRPWYVNSIKNRGINWTDVYIFYTDRIPGISCATPVYNEKNQLQGVVAIDISLAELSFFLEELKTEGEVFILNEKEQLIAMPLKEKSQLHKVMQTYQEKGVTKYRLMPIKQTSDPIIAKSFQAFMQTKKKSKWRSFLDKNYKSTQPDSFLGQLYQFINEEDQQVKFSHNKQTYLTMYAPFPAKAGWNWTIGIAIPENRFMTLIKWGNIVSAIVALLGIIVAICLGYFISNKISRPLAHLEKEMGKIKNFQLDSNENIHSKIREVERMAITFQQMKAGLRSFDKFVPSQLVRNLINEGQEAKLGGKKKELTMFFSDIVGFTSISESLQPEQLVEQLGEYLNCANDIIYRYQGTVDKFIGDSVMAFWGAPRTLKDHASLACIAALECQKALNKMSKKWLEQEKPIFKTRMGINTGEVIVGNMGAEYRMNYTAIGDSVNLASRLESINKYYGTEIIIGEETYQKAKDIVVVRILDYVAVKGKTKGVAIYELVGKKGEIEDNIQELVRKFSEGMESYRQRDWQKALDLFQKALEINPEDQPTQIFIKRCLEYLKKPPLDDWDGVFVATNK